MKLNIYIQVIDFARPDDDKSVLEPGKILARYLREGSAIIPPKWSILVAEIEVPDRIGLDGGAGESVVVPLTTADRRTFKALPDDIPIRANWVNHVRDEEALFFLPTKNLVAHAERNDCGFSLIKRHGYGIKTS